MPEEVAATLDNSDVDFNKALDRVLIDKQTVKTKIVHLKKMKGDYGFYWDLKLELEATGEDPVVATDTSGNPMMAGETITILINVPNDDASAGQKKGYMARLAGLQVAALGLDRPDSKIDMKQVEGHSVMTAFSVYSGGTNPKQQVDRFSKVVAS